ncbi:MAG: hypothetical protein ACTH2M_00120 [Microbacteriaceae bacterium]
MRAMVAIKLALGVAGIIVVLLIGYAMGSTSAEGLVDEVQVKQLNSCLPIDSTAELEQCMGLKIVGGQ